MLFLSITTSYLALSPALALHTYVLVYSIFLDTITSFFFYLSSSYTLSELSYKAFIVRFLPSVWSSFCITRHSIRFNILFSYSL